MRRQIIAGNWKMHGSKEQVLRFCRALGSAALHSGTDLLLFPPVAYLDLFVAKAGGTGVEFGAQDMHPRPKGPCTGDISGAMIVDLGGRWMLAGHSERRQQHGEDDGVVASKVDAALKASLKPVLCLGETLAEREAGEAEAVVVRQLQAVAEVVGAEGLAAGAIAYEPVWAIGTGVTATPEQADAMHLVIREALAVMGSAAHSIRVLYGGSINADNALSLFQQPNIDGGLVGGASLDAESFLAIAAAAC